MTEKQYIYASSIREHSGKVDSSETEIDPKEYLDAGIETENGQIASAPYAPRLISVIDSGEWQFGCDIPGNSVIQIIERAPGGIRSYSRISNDGRPLIEVDVHGWFRQGLPPGQAPAGWYGVGLNCWSFIARIRRGSDEDGSDFWLLNRSSNSRPFGDSVSGEDYSFDVGSANGGRLLVAMNDDFFKDNGCAWNLEVRIFDRLSFRKHYQQYARGLPRKNG